MQIPHEQIIIEFGNDNTMTLSKGEMGMKEIGETDVMHCDLCNTLIGVYKDIKHLYSPEQVTRAISNGLTPDKAVLEKERLLRIEIMANAEPIWGGSFADVPSIEGIVENWKTMAINSETPWAFCDSCNEQVEKYLNQKP